MEAEVRKLNSALTTPEAEIKLQQLETENTEMMASFFSTLYMYAISNFLSIFLFSFHGFSIDFP